ncbi:putative transcription factor cys6 protein [Botrytis fragariae]|uniref:Putative transcription factor cys6 protein n=1 Tax=Botrytis fragariae TaxID=1964551 RepID=A0A8H6EDW1_9HELO|nr:putative transcription factor cys6 protein [Botrytis fragariae]KAF5868739.1 putative transcription factor cys6 protein [Botrytis fragariae]
MNEYNRVAMGESVCLWSCCWCSDYTGTGMTTEIISCPGCAHVRCNDCPVQLVKRRSSHSTSNTRSTRATGSRARESGSSRGRESGNGDEGGQIPQSDAVLESTIDSTINAALLQDAQISVSAELNLDSIPQDTDASKPQEGKVKEFDTDHYNLNMVDTTKKSAKSSNAEERGFKGSGISSLKRESSDLQDPLNSQIPFAVPKFSEFALDRFIKNPTSYSEDIALLEHRIIQLGQNTFENIEEDGETKRYILSLRKLGIGTEPSTPLSPPFDQQLRINDYIQFQASISTETLSSILKGTQLLQHEGICNSSTYSIIVADIDRPKVLNVRPVSIPSLSLILELLREVQEFIQQEDNQQRDLVLEDVAEILMHIVVSLGLGIPQTVLAVGEHNRERQQDICHLMSSILSVLHVVLLSFVRSHLDNSGYTPSGSLSDGLHIECPGGTLFLAARRLKCLNGFLKQPVWALNFIPTNSKLSKVECDGFYLSSSIDHLAELWGPLRVNRTEVLTASSIETHGGRLLSAEHDISSVQPLESELLCHWSSWMETNSLENKTPIDTAKLLLIGVRTIPQASQELQRLPRFHKIDLCNCPDQYISQPRHRAFELGTRPPNWKMKERTAQASGGQYLTITLGATYKFDAGWTLKDVILEDWVNAGKTDASHTPNPYLMDCLAVLDFSCCSGHARRISLWALLKDLVTRGYLYQKFDNQIENSGDIVRLLDGLISVDSLSSIWTTIPATQRKLLIFSFKEILKILKFTGIGDDKKLQAWDITYFNRNDGRKLAPRWSSFVKDDSNSATFAVITSNCVRYSQSNDQALTDTVLQTQLCITAAQKINRGLAASKKDAETQDTQSSSSATFSSRWAVNRSRVMDVQSRQSADRYQTMNTDSRQPPPADQCDTEKRLLERIRNNQKGRQIGSDAASQSSLTGNDPPLLASQYPSNNLSPSRKRLKTEAYSITPSAITHPPILHIRNSLGRRVGNLSLEPATPIDLTFLTDETTLQAKWEEVSRMNLAENFRKKEAQLDKSISSWVRKSNGFIPSLIGRLAPVEGDLSPLDVVEYIRPGSLTAYQKLVNVYIH